MLDVPAPLVMEPFEIDQAYVAPAPAFGTEAAIRLDEIELSIDRHLATLLLISSRAPMPSLRLVQAPVFHGYSLSVWVEFETDVNQEELSETLATAQIEVRSAEQEVPTNVGAAAQSGVAAGDIRIDRNNPRAAWIWLALDNLRMTADGAAELLRPVENK